MSESVSDMSGLLAHAQQMQQQLVEAQETIARTEVTGSAGGGLVTARVTGAGELVGLSIDPRVVQSGPPTETAEAIADLVLAAVRNANQEAEALRERGHEPDRRRAGRARTAGSLRSLRNLVYEGIVQDLIDELGRLPGIGPKSAQRIAFYLLAADATDVRRLAQTMLEVKDRVKFCGVCGNVAEADECRICRDPRRDLSVICVVEEPKDVVAVERSREFRGRYHVLGGAISPIDGVGPDDLRVRELMTRLADGTVTELILATNPNLEGEATATYLARLVKPMGLRVTRPGEWAAGRRRSRVRGRSHARTSVRRKAVARCLTPRGAGAA